MTTPQVNQPQETAEAEKLRKLEYYRADGKWELGLADLCQPLGNIALAYRDAGKSVSRRRSKLRRELNWLAPRIENWNNKYREWREEQGNPLHGEYANLPQIKAPLPRLAAAAKEIHYRNSRQEPDQASTALKDLIQAAEDHARYLRRRQEGHRIQAAAEAAAAEAATRN